MPLLFQPGSRILFQGDSITDASRNRADGADLGKGYALIAASRLQASHPEMGWTFLNRGISGNRVRDLRSRWEEDCINLKPDCVSVLIGINDCWRRYDRQDPTSVDDYEADYRAILEPLRNDGVRIIICEPFVLPVPPDRMQWREDLDPKIDVARRLARDYAERYVAFDGVFAAASVRKNSEYWAGDGVHPTPAGHALMADAWVASVSD